MHEYTCKSIHACAMLPVCVHIKPIKRHFSGFNWISFQEAINCMRCFVTSSGLQSQPNNDVNSTL